MNKVITFINEKGGVGKSSVCFNTTWELANQGKNILIMDLYGQKANISFFTGVDKENITTMVDVLKHNVDINSCIVNIKENFDIIPANSSVVGIDITTKVSKLRKFTIIMTTSLSMLTQLLAGRTIYLFQLAISPLSLCSPILRP